MEDFLREAACMKEFDHANVMRLLGESGVSCWKHQVFSHLPSVVFSHLASEILNLKTRNNAAELNCPSSKG